MERMMRRWLCRFGLLVLLAGVVVGARGQTEQNLNTASFRQNIGESLPDVRFTDRFGESVALGQLAADRPVVLVMSWFECPHLCPMVLNNLAKTINQLPFGTEGFRVVVVSIDPEETPDTAQALVDRLQQRHAGIPGDWTFLTGNPTAIDSLADAVGFRYAYDEQRDSYAHPAGLVVVSPGGTVNRYLFGARPEAPDLRLALLEAADGELGSAIDQVVLRCYRFDVDSGRYNLAVMRLVQAAGGTFLITLVLLIWWMRRRNSRE